MILELSFDGYKLAIMLKGRYPYEAFYKIMELIEKDRGSHGASNIHELFESLVLHQCEWLEDMGHGALYAKLRRMYKY